MDYTTLSLAEVRTGLERVAHDATETFGGLDAAQLNWRPPGGGWSVAQCFEHLLLSNRMMTEAGDRAMDPAQPVTLWQRLPVLPGLFGRFLVRAMSPQTPRKVKTTTRAEPPSEVGADVITRFAAQQREAAARTAALDETTAARRVMVSPFIGIVSYSVLDGWRLMLAHDRRHFEQARRVVQAPGFPAPAAPAAV